MTEISTAGPSPSTNQGVNMPIPMLQKGHFHRTSKKCKKCVRECKQTVFTALGGKWFCWPFREKDPAVLFCDTEWVVKLLPASIPS